MWLKNKLQTSILMKWISISISTSIVQEISQKNDTSIHEHSSNDSDYEEETDSPQENFTSAMTLDSLQKLQNYLSINVIQEWSHLNGLEHQLQGIILKNAKKTRQITLNDWLNTSK